MKYVYGCHTKHARKGSDNGSANDEEWLLCDMQPSLGSLVSQYCDLFRYCVLVQHKRKVWLHLRPLFLSDKNIFEETVSLIES